MQQKSYSVAEMSRILGWHESTTHRRIQLAIELDFIQVQGKGERVRYSERDLLVVKILNAAYRLVSSNQELIELLSPKKAKDVQENGVGHLISTIVNAANEMLIQYANVANELETVHSMNTVLNRNMVNIQDKMDALWRKMDKIENSTHY